jgi:hypothetical protein
VAKSRHGDSELEKIRRELDGVMAAMETAVAQITAAARTIAAEGRGTQITQVGRMWNAIESITHPLAAATATVNGKRNGVLQAVEAAIVAIAVAEERENPPGEPRTWRV